MSLGKKRVNSWVYLSAILVPFLIMAVSMTIVMGEVNRNLQAAKMEMEGIHDIRLLEQVAILLQDLRGLASIELNGGRDYTEKKQILAENIISNLETLIKDPHSELFATRDALKALLSRALDVLYGENGQKDVIKIYTSFLKEIDLVRMVTASNSFLSLDPDVYTYHLMTLIVEEIPSIIDASGEMLFRTLGEVSSGPRSGNSNVQLAANLNRLDENVQALKLTVKTLTQVSPIVTSEVEGISEQILSRAEKYKGKVLRALNPEGAGINPEALFTESTVFVDHLVTVSDNMSELLNSELEKRSSSLQNRLILSFIGIILTLLLMFYFTRSFYKTNKALEMVNTELDLTQKILTEKAKALNEANKELSQYAYVVSHDLKSPLRAIHNYAQFIMEDLSGTLSGDTESYLNGLHKAVEESEELVDDLLQISAIGKNTGNLETINLGKFLNDIVASMDTPQNVEIVISKGMPVIESQHTLLKQIFSNLIQNGIKFNELKKKIIEIGCSFTDANYVEVFVKDNGIGIDPKYHEQIFKVFQRLHTRQEYSGTGIGLAIVRKATEKLRGSIRIESMPNTGSTFFIRLPVKSKEMEEEKDG